jgi:hypothetical protein
VSGLEVTGKVGGAGGESEVFSYLKIEMVVLRDMHTGLKGLLHTFQLYSIIGKA